MTTAGRSPLRSSADTRSVEPRQELLLRVRRIIGDAGRGCACRVTLDDALDRYAALELARLRAGDLRKARAARAAIAALVGLLADLDETPDVESDPTVFAEFADLFETIAVEAGAAAALLRRLEAL